MAEEVPILLTAFGRRHHNHNTVCSMGKSFVANG